MRIVSLLLLLFLTGDLFSQIDFDNYRTLESHGPVPLDFSLRTQEKIEQDKKEPVPGLSKRKSERFIVEVNYSIDELLKSGLVTYGDPVSAYLQRIGDKLCASDSDLVGKLRFYTLNANEANAFSTNQGMVFVTTGLIAQMTTEAQLAYVLAHEIIHYREKHVLDLYGYVNENKSLSYNEKIRFFTKYSRDNEFEADQEGLKLYHAAGYASSEVVKTFDVLIYSYLPFEEVPFRKDYFNTEFMFVPAQLLTQKPLEIRAKTRYFDRYNSHPNVYKRIQSLEAEIDTLKDWGTKLQEEGSAFKDVRMICRYEYLLNCIYDENTVEALYSVFLLEHSYPSSTFLKHCKSQIWLEEMKVGQQTDEFGLGQTGYIYDGIDDQAGYLEGEISVLGKFLLRLPSEGKVSLGLRNIYDSYKKDTTDLLQKKMWEKAIETTAFNENFELKDFSKLTFDEAVEHAAEQLKKQQADSTSNPVNYWDKYESISNRKSGLTLSDGVDSSRFYLYGISDLVSDSAFIKKYDFYRSKSREKEAEEDDYFELTDDEQVESDYEKYQEALNISADTLLFIQPLVTEVGRFKADYKGSEELEERLITAVKEVGRDLSLEVKQLDRTEQNTMTTEQYNDLCFLMRCFQKSVIGSKPDVFILDQSRLDDLRKRYGASKVLLVNMSHSYDSGITIGTGVLFTVLFPVGLIYFPIAVLSGHKTDMDIYVIDLEKGELIIERNYYSSDQASKKMLEHTFNGVFTEFQKTKDEDSE